MQAIRKVAAILPGLFFVVAVKAQVDSVFYQKDSVIVTETEPTVIFFQGNEKLATLTKTTVITRARKTISLSSFLGGLGSNADHVLADLDNDGKKELLVYNYTGGAHCCDEIYVFKNTAANKYQHVARLYAGNTVIRDSNLFVYNFHQQFGYFFTCFACKYDDTPDEAPIRVNRIRLKYNNGRMLVIPGDQELRSKINDNLAKLGEQPYQPLDDGLAQDNGLRKEVAMNLAVFYYSFGKNLAATRGLFNKYYKFPDARKVWNEFVKTLNSLKRQSDI